MPKPWPAQLRKIAHSRALQPRFPLPCRPLVNQREPDQVDRRCRLGITRLKHRAGESEDAWAREHLGTQALRNRGILQIEDVRIDIATAEIRRAGRRLEDDPAAAERSFQLGQSFPKTAILRGSERDRAPISSPVSRRPSAGGSECGETPPCARSPSHRLPRERCPCVRMPRRPARQANLAWSDASQIVDLYSEFPQAALVHMGHQCAVL